MLFVVFIVSPYGGNAYAIDCGYSRPDVLVKKNKAPIEYIRNFTSAGLTQLHTGAYRPGGGNVLGLGGGLMSVDIEIEFETMADNSVSCLRPSRVVADFTIHPAVMIARNYESGSCEYKAVLEHEHKHVDTLVRFQNRSVPKLRKAISMAVSNHARPKAVATVNVDFMREQMRKNVIQDVQIYLEHMQKIAAAQQKKVDTQEEYSRVAALCENW